MQKKRINFFFNPTGVHTKTRHLVPLRYQTAIANLVCLENKISQAPGMTVQRQPNTKPCHCVGNKMDFMLIAA